MKIRVYPATVLLSLLCSWPSWTQVATVSGSITGTVRDPYGGMVGQAAVTAKNLGTGFTRTTNTNGAGEFEIPLLPPGKYEVEVVSRGFSTHNQSGIDVKLGQASRVAVSLSVSASG
jgi:hypothetical protein